MNYMTSLACAMVGMGCYIQSTSHGFVFDDMKVSLCTLYFTICFSSVSRVLFFETGYHEEQRREGWRWIEAWAYIPQRFLGCCG